MEHRARVPALSLQIPPPTMIKVVFACRSNAGSSQMAAAWFNALASPERARAISAGTEPAREVHPDIVLAMAEVGLDLSGAKPKRISSEMLADATDLVTLGFGSGFPLDSAPLPRRDWLIEDPEGLPMERVREIRGEVRTNVLRLISSWGVNSWRIGSGATQ
jgi:arsenate reductase